MVLIYIHDVLIVLGVLDSQSIESKFVEGFNFMRETRDLFSSEDIFPFGYSEFIKFSDDQRLGFFLSALLYFFSNDTYKEKNKSLPVSHYIILHSVKVSDKFYNFFQI